MYLCERVQTHFIPETAIATYIGGRSGSGSGGGDSSKGSISNPMLRGEKYSFRMDMRYRETHIIWYGPGCGTFNGTYRWSQNMCRIVSI